MAVDVQEVHWVTTYFVQAVAKRPVLAHEHRQDCVQDGLLANRPGRNQGDIPLHAGADSSFHKRWVGTGEGINNGHAERAGHEKPGMIFAC